MSYTKVGWKDYPQTKTPVSAANLDKMDSQILANATNIGDLDGCDVEGTSLVDKLNTLNGYMPDMVKIVSTSCTKVTVAASSYSTANFSVTIPSGYKLLANFVFDTGHSNLSAYFCSQAASGYVGVRNLISGSVSGTPRIISILLRDL